MKEKKKVGGLTLPNFKVYYKATVIRQCGIGERMKKYVNGLEEGPDIDPHKYSQLIFNEGAKAIQIVLEQLDITYKKKTKQKSM